VGWDWVHLVLRPLFGLLYQPQMIDGGDCRVIGGVKIDRGNWSTRRKPTPAPLCPPHIPRDPGSNPGHRGGMPATNRLSYGAVRVQPTAFIECIIQANTLSLQTNTLYRRKTQNNYIPQHNGILIAMEKWPPKHAVSLPGDVPPIHSHRAIPT
jgi:hypothetical protein